MHFLKNIYIDNSSFPALCGLAKDHTISWSLLNTYLKEACNPDSQ